MNFVDKYSIKFIEKIYDVCAEKIFKIDREIKNRTCLGNEMLGWQDLDKNVNLSQINEISNQIRESADAVFVIGIGGSYLGAKMAIDFLRPNCRDKIFFLGQNLDSDYIDDIFKKCENKSVYVLVISKSGNTLEIKATLDIVMQFMSRKYGNEMNKRFLSITGKSGYLRDLSVERNWKILNIPQNVGGRFSVLTSVGLLPIAISGANIENLLDGAELMKNQLDNLTSDCHRYAVARSALYKIGFKVELFSSFSVRMISAMEWLKQLFGESEGKDGKGLFPSSAFFSTDLHSLGQFIQEGSKILFETIIFCENTEKNMKISSNIKDDFLKNKTLSYINKKILDSVLISHSSGGVPCNLITLDEFSEKELGKFIYFFEYACSLSALFLKVNPFNQPGVEIYKKNIYCKI